MKRTFNAREVANALDVSERTISRHIKQGKLDAAKPGKAYVITRGDLAEYLGGMKRVEELFGTADAKEKEAA